MPSRLFQRMVHDYYMDNIMEKYFISEKDGVKSSFLNERWVQEADFLGKLDRLEAIYWQTVYGGMGAGGIIWGAESSPVFRAIEKDSIDFLERYFSDPSADTEIVLNKIPGLTPLVFACSTFAFSVEHRPDYESLKKKLNIVKFLISKGANVNSRCETLRTPLPGFSNVTALFLAIKSRNVSLIRLLIDSGADVGAQMLPLKITLVHQAAYGDLPDICTKLIELGADINLEDIDGNTPLIIACASGCSSVAKVLINEKADVNITNVRNVTALHAAVFGCGPEIVQLLLGAGANVHVKTNEGHTPLDMAIFMKKNKLKKLIIEAKGSSSLTKRGRAPNPLQSYLVPSYGGVTPLHAAALGNYLDDVKYFLGRGCSVNVTDAQGQTPLFSAVMGGCVFMVEFLLKLNADPNIVNAHGITPLHMAASAGLLQICRTLLNYGAGVDTRPQFIQPYLITAAEIVLWVPEEVKVRKTKVAEMLIKQGAPFDERFKGHEAMEFAVRHENLTMVTLLQTQIQLFRFIVGHNLIELKKCIASGAVLNCRSVKFGTPLQCAVMKNRLDIIAILIESGADVNYNPAGSLTALQLAAKANHYHIARYLLMNGAAFDLRTAEMKTPLEVCLENNAEDCETAVLLRTAEATFKQGNVSDLQQESNENRHFAANDRYCEGKPVGDVRPTED